MRYRMPLFTGRFGLSRGRNALKVLGPVRRHV